MSNGNKKKKKGDNHSRDNYCPLPFQTKDLRNHLEKTKKIYDTEPIYKPKIYLTPEKWLVALGLISVYVGFTVGFILRNTLYLIH